MTEGQLIVLEGVDGAGTTTHTRELSRALKQAGWAVHATAEPSAGPIGAVLRQTISGRFVVSDSEGNVRPPAWNTMALMFAADRLDHVESELNPQLRAGVNVVCDRYYHSSIAYQSITGGGIEAIEWIREINRFARTPDLTVVLDVPAAVAEERRRRRGSGEIFDDQALQRKLCVFYAELERHFPNERIVHVDADRPQIEVARSLLAEVQKL